MSSQNVIEAIKAAKQNKTAHMKYKHNELSYEEYRTIQTNYNKICAKEAKRADN
jgi:hypothetical protein